MCKNLKKLMAQSSHCIAALEDLKQCEEHDHDQVRRYALDAAQAEAEVFVAQKKAGVPGQDLAITLVSQASCLVDASRIKEAIAVFNRASQCAETKKFKDWIAEEVKSILENVRDIPDKEREETLARFALDGMGPQRVEN